MLIMSQGEDVLYNLDRIDNIQIEPMGVVRGDKDDRYYIELKQGDDSYWLGLYKNRERAMEVLEEIGSEYCLLTNEEKGYVANGMYYMPKE